jgi:hypothetical protein
MVITGLNPKNVENNWSFIQAMGEVMTGRANNDGLGYTAVDKSGNIFGERWLDNEEAFDVREPVSKVKDKFLGFMEDEPEVVKYSAFGKRTDEIVAITLHTRFATSAKGILNTHPFVDEDKDTSLIHNGVITNVNYSDHIRSTCDSERILNKYLEFNVGKNPVAIQALVDSLVGNFACGIITRDEHNRRVIDVFKSRAGLGGGIVRELDNAMVITTDKTDIKAVCKHLGMKMMSQHTAKEDLLIRLEASSGKALLSMKYTDTARQHSTHTSTAHGGNGLGRYDHHLGRYVYNSELTQQSSTVVTQAELEAKRQLNAKKMEDERRVVEDIDVTYTQAELEDMVKREENRQADADKVVAKVTSDLEQSKAVVARAKNIYDPMDEDGATKDGWFLERDGSWAKLDKKAD